MVASDPPLLRFLVAGAGAFGLEHLDRLSARKDVRIAGVADPSPAALATARRRYGIAQCFSQPQQMLEHVSADALIVATPSASHVAITLQALARNLGVLLEKPVAPSAAEAARLAQSAADAGGLVLPGHVLRFSRDHRRLVEIVGSGLIGQVCYVNSRRYRDDAHATRYRDVDPVLMTMIHDIDLALWIVQSPFRSASARRYGTDGFRSMTVANLVAESGVICDLRTAWTFPLGDLPPDRVEVVGESGSIELEAGHALTLHAEGRRTSIALAAGDDALANEQDHFIACLRDRGQRPVLNLHDAAAGLRLGSAIVDSLRCGHAVTPGE